MVWPHSSKKRLPVPPRTAAAISLMRSGIADLSLIANAVGLPLEEIQRIDAAEDPAVRRMAVHGIPDEFIFRLRVKVTCPTCGNRIYLTPCVLCKLAGLRAKERDPLAARRPG